MKRGLLLTLLMGCCFFLQQESIAQAYYAMPTGPAQWDMARCWYFYPAGWHDLYYITMDGTDTLFNGKTYKKLYHTTHHAPGTEFDSTYTHFLGGMREADKQVFMFSEWLCLDTIERMIYDFHDVVEGDTIYSQVLTNGGTNFIPHMVTGVDEVEVGGDPRRQIHLTDENGWYSETWTEGVGSSFGLIYATYWILTDNSYDLNCFYEGNVLSYTNPSPAYAFCTAPYPEVECAPIISSTMDKEADLELTLYPNPVVSSLFVEGWEDIRSVAGYNLLGVNVLEIPCKRELNLSSLPPGIYFLRFQAGKSGQVVVRRIVKV
jgi:hypothetical protein